MNLFICIMAFSVLGLSIVLLAEAIKDRSIWRFIVNFIGCGINFYMGLKYFFTSIGWL